VFHGRKAGRDRVLGVPADHPAPAAAVATEHGDVVEDGQGTQ
jgi:hypothetical protein